MSTNAGIYNLTQCGYAKCAPCTMQGYEGEEIAFVCRYLDRIVKAGQLKGVFVDIGNDGWEDLYAPNGFVSGETMKDT